MNSKDWTKIWYRTPSASITHNDLFFTTLFSGKPKPCSTSSKEVTRRKKPSLRLPYLSYSFLNCPLLTTSRHNLVYTLLWTRYIPQQQLHSGCQIFSHIAKLKIYKQYMKIKKTKQQKPNQTKKASHVFHVMVHLFYSFHVLATWCRYLYWKHNLKYKTYQ